MNSYFEAKDLILHYDTSNGRLKAVDKVNIEIPNPGQSTAIVGESGCGKSSIASLLLRLLPNNTKTASGIASLDGQEFLNIREEDFRKYFRWKQIAWVPQNTKASLDPLLTLEGHFKELYNLHRVPYNNSMIKELLARVGLSQDVGLAIPDHLSGGEIQRACLAMAIMLNPSLIILDEPTSSLDPSLKGQITILLDELRTDNKTSFLYITHDVFQARFICDYITIIYAGKVVESGHRDIVFNNPVHPYSRALLECARNDEQATKPVYIVGEPPVLHKLPPGCAFKSRCNFASEECSRFNGNIVEIEPGHFVACLKV